MVEQRLFGCHNPRHARTSGGGFRRRTCFGRFVVRRRRKACLKVGLLGVCVVAWLGIPVVAAEAVTAAAVPPRIDHYGKWPLTKLGISRPLEIEGQPGRSQTSITYRLPDDAAQGPHDWFVLNLHLRLELSRSSGTGGLVIGAATNGFPTAQVEVMVQTGNRRSRLSWRSVDIVDGLRH